MIRLLPVVEGTNRWFLYSLKANSICCAVVTLMLMLLRMNCNPDNIQSDVWFICDKWYSKSLGSFTLSMFLKPSWGWGVGRHMRQFSVWSTLILASQSCVPSSLHTAKPNLQVYRARFSEITPQWVNLFNESIITYLYVWTVH